MPKTALSASSSLVRSSLILPLLALVLALALPWDGALLSLSIALYALVLAKTDERRATLTRIGIVWLFILLGTLPLLIEQARADSIVRLWGWGIGAQSIALFRHIALRAFAAFGAMLLLTTLNPMYQLIADMRAAGVPRLVVDIIELTYRYIYVLEETARQIALAQVSRHGYSGGYRTRLSHLSLLLSRTFVLAHSQADEIYDGLVSRGFEQEAETLTPPPPASPTLLRLGGIKHRYRAERYALSSVSLSVSRGERIALLGENGAGKSTLMRLISGLMPLQEGTIELCGEPVSADNVGMRRLRRSIALVMQNSNHQLFAPTVEEEIAFGLKNIGFDGERLRERIGATVEQYDLESIRLLPPHKLSEGQKKWVALAAILATDPEIILLDEPTASLDRHYTKRVMALLADLHRAGKTIVLSTHDMNLAYDWADRLLVMHQGSLIGDGKACDVFANDAVLASANLERPLLFRPKPERNDRVVDSDFSLGLFHRGSALSALIVGGGSGALRKVTTLLEHSARCCVLSPTLCPELLSLAEQGRIHWVEKTYQPTHDLCAYSLVVAATGQRALDHDICQRAMRMGILACNLSTPTKGNIQFAAQHLGSGVSVAVHTHHRLPEVAQCIRQEIGRSLGGELEQSLVDLARFREQIKGFAKEQGDPSAAQIEAKAQYEALKDKVIQQIRYDWVNRN